jgi:hypothetical protein
MSRLVKFIRAMFRALPVTVGVVLVLTLLLTTAVNAQVPSQIKVSSPDTSQYPRLSISFWPFDADGNFVNNISTSTLNVFENEKQVRIQSLQLLEPGTHFVLAINEAKTLGNSYAGKTRLAYLKEAWLAWVEEQAITTMDDFTLVNNDKIVEDQLDTPSQWADAIENYQPTLDTTSPTLGCLTLAIDALSNSTDVKTRAILLVTPLPDENQLNMLEDAIAKAQAGKIHLFIWLIGPQTNETENAATVLKEAAEATEGSFFSFSGAETLPALASYLDPLRFKYQVVYDSFIQETGTYTIEVQVDQADFQKRSDKVSFDITVAAPNPIFLSPPSSVTRSWVKNDETRKWSLTPSQQIINFMLEFPDGHTRSLSLSQLYVDGMLAVENKSEPFNEFNWDLSQYTETADHKLQIKIEDEAGLSAATVEIPITVVVEQKPLNFIQRFIDDIGWQTLGISLFLILVAAGLVVLFLRLRLRNPSDDEAQKKAQRDPLRQKAILETAEAQPGQPSPKDESAAGFRTRLVYMSGAENALPANAVFNLPEHSTKLGSDPVRCDIVLKGTTISPVHAEIITDNVQNYFVADRGSAAGTWLNYAPVSSLGTKLEHGDILHIGTWAFRFEVANAKKRTIQVLPYKE